MAKQYLMPYTNLHELNLDWLINAMKQLESQWDTYGTEVSATVESLPSGSKAEIEVTGSLKDHMNFGFKIPGGDTGTTFYPEVSKDGVISWYNEDGKQNPPSVNIKGPQGAQGPAGSGLFILDTYVTLDELKAAHPTGLSGNAYLIGTAPNFIMYVWSTDRSEWTNAGSIAAPSPSTSVPLADADVGSTGVENAYARGDHAHPHDDTKLDKASSDETSIYGVSGSDQILFPFSTFATDSELELKQDKLISGSTIKTINGENILGSGDITINSDIGKLKLTQLWSNANLLSEMAEQTLTFTTGDYPFYIIRTVIFSSSDKIDPVYGSHMFYLLQKNIGTFVTQPSGEFYYRKFKITDTGMYISSCTRFTTYASTTDTKNNSLIPELVFGVNIEEN